MNKYEIIDYLVKRGGKIDYDSGPKNENTGNVLELKYWENIPVHFNGYSIDFSENSITYVGESGEFGRTPLNLFAMIGFLVFHRMMGVGQI